MEAVKKVNEENEMLLHELHRAQEALERQYVEFRSAQDSYLLLKQQYDRMRSAYPYYWDLEDLSVCSRGNTDQGGITDWSVKNSIVQGSYIDNLCFSIDISKKSGYISFPKLINGALVNTWAHWGANNKAQEMLVLTSKGTFVARNNSLVPRKLTTAEWLLIKVLPRMLVELISTKAGYFKDKINSADYTKFLESLVQAMGAWNMSLRYDAIDVVGMSELPNYRSVSLRIENLSLGERLEKNLHVTLSTFDEGVDDFGTHPRLEFYSDSKNVFESWYAETQDEKGERLELRFALPEDMDLSVWRKLSDTDRLMIAGLVSALPKSLERLQAGNSHFTRNRQRWVVISSNMLDILRKTLAGQSGQAF